MQQYTVHNTVTKLRYRCRLSLRLVALYPAVEAPDTPKMVALIFASQIYQASAARLVFLGNFECLLLSVYIHLAPTFHFRSCLDRPFNRLILSTRKEPWWLRIRVPNTEIRFKHVCQEKFIIGCKSDRNAGFCSLEPWS